MSDLWLAVDGGQTATLAIVATAEGHIRGVGRGGPLRNERDPDAEQLAHRAMTTAVGDAIQGVREGDAVVVGCLALTGSERFAESAVRGILPAAEVVVLENDALAVLAAGTLGGGGIGLIAGTGSVAVATGRSGAFIRRGGWGWLLGDEGGGYWIGREALRAAAREADGTGPRTALTTGLPSRLRQDDMEGVRDVVTGGRVDRSAIAGLAPLVVELADAGDPVAASVVEDAACHLRELVAATITAAPFLEADERVVVGGGGVLEPGARVARRLANLLEDAAPGFRFVSPDVPPVIGALYLGLKYRGITIDDATHSQAAADSTAFGLHRKTP